MGAEKFAAISVENRFDQSFLLAERDRFQENAPSVTDGLYLVPKVIE